MRQDEDARLLAASLRDVAPIKATPRAALDTPKPLPVRLRFPAEKTAEPHDAPRTTPLDTLDDGAYFRAMMDEVMPLKDAGRIEPGRRGPRTAAQATTDEDTISPASLLLAGILPHDADSLAPEALFQRATLGIQPLDQRNRVALETPRPSPEPLKRQADEQAALQESLHSPLSLEDRLDGGDETAFIRPGIPRRVLTDLRRGRWVLQGEIDLHGLNRDQAREALGLFLADSLRQGRRCVRVIHGKGLGSPGKHSILKHLSRGWLAQRAEILAFCQAAPNHGGSGALMVLLQGAGRQRTASAALPTVPASSRDAD